MSSRGAQTTIRAKSRNESSADDDHAGACKNVLVSVDSSADRSNTPASKSVVISIAPFSDTTEAINRIRSEARLLGVCVNPERIRGSQKLSEDNAFGVRVNVKRGRPKKTNQRLIAFTRELHRQGGGG